MTTRIGHPKMTIQRKRKCNHEWEQINKEFYITNDGMPAKKLIDVCQKCGKRRER